MTENQTENEKNMKSKKRKRGVERRKHKNIDVSSSMGKAEEMTNEWILKWTHDDDKGDDEHHQRKKTTENKKTSP